MPQKYELLEEEDENYPGESLESESDESYEGLREGDETAGAPKWLLKLLRSGETTPGDAAKFMETVKSGEKVSIPPPGTYKKYDLPEDEIHGEEPALKDFVRPNRPPNFDAPDPEADRMKEQYDRWIRGEREQEMLQNRKRHEEQQRKQDSSDYATPLKAFVPKVR